MPSKYRPKNTAYLNQPHSGRKSPPTGTDADLNLSTLTRLFSDETAVREFLEAKRWGKVGRHCPHCGCTTTYALVAKPGSKSPVRPGVYKCKACRQQFTVRIGTIFDESKLPLSKWLMAIHLMTSSKKGISSHQISRELGCTQKTAWFLNHRIREAMRQEPLAGMLSGNVEMDETYVGPRRVRKHSGKPSKRGRGTEKKPVLVLIERDGRARSMPIPNATGATLRAEALSHVDPSAVVHSDEWSGYRKMKHHFASHRTVNHAADEYSRCDDDGVIAGVNTAESFFALLKRGHYGSFHHFSRKHTHRYCDEFSFRWDHRKISDGERMVAAIEGAEGKRLMYREPVSAE